MDNDISHTCAFLSASAQELGMGYKVRSERMKRDFLIDDQYCKSVFLLKIITNHLK